MQIFIYCTCGAGLEVESITLDNGHGEISLTIKRCAGCEQEDIQCGYDDRLAEEEREQADNPIIREVLDVLEDDLEVNNEETR